MIEDLQGQKTTQNHSVITESLKEELSYLGNKSLTKTQIINTITEIQYFASTSATQSSSNTKEPFKTCLEITHNCTIDLTENNKSKPSGSQSIICEQYRITTTTKN